MYPADRAVLGEPALPGGVVDHAAARWALRPGHPLEDQPAQAGPNQISGGGSVHPPILSPGPPGETQPLEHRLTPYRETGRKARSWYFDGQEFPRANIVCRWLTTLLWFWVVVGLPEMRGRSVSSQAWPKLVSI